MRRATPIMHHYASTRARDEDPRERLRRIAGLPRAAVPRRGTRLTPVGLLDAAGGRLGRAGRWGDAGLDTASPGWLNDQLTWMGSERQRLASEWATLRRRARLVNCDQQNAWNAMVGAFQDAVGALGDVMADEGATVQDAEGNTIPTGAAIVPYVFNGAIGTFVTGSGCAAPPTIEEQLPRRVPIDRTEVIEAGMPNGRTVRWIIGMLVTLVLGVPASLALRDFAAAYRAEYEGKKEVARRTGRWPREEETSLLAGALKPILWTAAGVGAVWLAFKAADSWLTERKTKAIAQRKQYAV